MQTCCVFSYALYALSQGVDNALTLLVGARGSLLSAHAPLDPLFPRDRERELQLDRLTPAVVGSLGVRHDLSPQVSWTASLLSAEGAIRKLFAVASARLGQ